MENLTVLNQELLVAVKEKVISELEITEPFEFEDDLTQFGLDSLSTVKLLVALEEEFQIAFDDEDLLLDNFTSIVKITEMIMKRGE